MRGPESPVRSDSPVTGASLTVRSEQGWKPLLDVVDADRRTTVLARMSALFNGLLAALLRPLLDAASSNRPSTERVWSKLAVHMASRTCSVRVSKVAWVDE